MCIRDRVPPFRDKRDERSAAFATLSHRDAEEELGPHSFYFERIRRADSGGNGALRSDKDCANCRGTRDRRAVSYTHLDVYKRQIIVGATILALFPLALEGGPLWKPLCYAKIGGLAVATFITLLLVPVFYSIFVLDLDQDVYKRQRLWRTT